MYIHPHSVLLSSGLVEEILILPFWTYDESTFHKLFLYTLSIYSFS